MMDLVVPLFFARLVYLAFVEESVYNNKRVNEIYEYSISALKAFGWVNYSLITKKYAKILTDMLLDPLIKAQAPLDISVVEEEENNKTLVKIKADPVEVKLEKIKKTLREKEREYLTV